MNNIRASAAGSPRPSIADTDTPFPSASAAPAVPALPGTTEHAAATTRGGAARSRCLLHEGR